ncbi:hypothetical protein BDF21DRAFT_420322 [Thamnidium elegans]|nr:hypothetical protein BDF21DRAFT_420322 [Thamnidium elegans]
MQKFIETLGGSLTQNFGWFLPILWYATPVKKTLVQYSATKLYLVSTTFAFAIGSIQYRVWSEIADPVKKRLTRALYGY